ncbi:calcium/sodium antiporter [bacterium]|nr:calcium/sodium antiporter [bacterium]
MGESILLLTAGLIMLTAGAEGLVRGSSGLALRLGVSPLVTGLTIVAFGTSMPEMVVSLKAALQGYSGIAIGNVVGSNIFNVAVILGVSALVRPLTVGRQIIRQDMPVMLAASFLFVMFFVNGSISRVEGGLLLTGFLIYLLMVVRAARRKQEAPDTPRTARSVFLNILMTGAGLALLTTGAGLFVTNAVTLAELLGVSRAVIGLTIISVGTSLPELATSVVAAAHKETDIAVGNIVGSNLFNILGILGVTSLTIPLSGNGVTLTDLFFMAGSSLLLLPFMRTGFRLNRLEGAALLAMYAAYLIYRWP